MIPFKALSILKECITRWSSLYYALERVFKIFKYLENSVPENFYLSKYEFDLLKFLIETLSILKKLFGYNLTNKLPFPL